MEITEENGAPSTRPCRKKRPTAFDMKTLPYPGFPTDMQAQVMALMALRAG